MTINAVKVISQVKNCMVSDLAFVFLKRIHQIKIIKSKLVSETGVVRLPWQLICFYNNFLFFQMLEVLLFVTEWEVPQGETDSLKKIRASFIL